MKKKLIFFFRALDLLSGKTVAIKQIDLKSSKKQDIKDMIVKEEEIKIHVDLICLIYFFVARSQVTEFTGSSKYCKIRRIYSNARSHKHCVRIH
jgi:hypothetical protein